jgi:hypothetical protein
MSPVGSEAAGTPGPLMAMLARRRVALGLAVTLATLVLARPTWKSWFVGLIVALLGQAFRAWAAGHIEKDREVTTSGPYQWVRHPLYVGSSVMALGIVLAARSWVVAVLTTVYLVATIGAAVVTEESRLRRAFGDQYDRYARDRGGAVGGGSGRASGGTADRSAGGTARTFSWDRAMRNREYRSMAGLAGGFLLLALRVAFNL